MATLSQLGIQNHAGTQTPSTDSTTSDANNQLVSGYMTKLLEKIKNGYTPTVAEQNWLGLAAVKFVPGSGGQPGHLQYPTWWQVNGQVVLAAAAVVGAGILMGVFTPAAVTSSGVDVAATTTAATTTPETASVVASSGVLPSTAVGTGDVVGVGGGAAAGGTSVAAGIAPSGAVVGGEATGVAAPGAATLGTGSTMSGLSRFLNKDTLTAAGKAITSASDQSTKNNQNAASMYPALASEEDKQRMIDQQNIFRAGFNQNFKGTAFDPNFTNLGGPQYASTMAGLSTQAAADLKNPRRFSVANAPSLTPSTMSQIGDYLGLGLGVLGTVYGK